MTVKNAVLSVLILVTSSGIALAQTLTTPQSSGGARTSTQAKSPMTKASMKEAKELQERQVEGTGRKAYSPETAVKFKASDNVFCEERARDRFYIQESDGDVASIQGPVVHG